MSEEFDNYSELSEETSLVTLSTLSMESMNTEEMWSLDNEMYEEEPNGRYPPQMQGQYPPQTQGPPRLAMREVAGVRDDRGMPLNTY